MLTMANYALHFKAIVADFRGKQKPNERNFADLNTSEYFCYCLIIWKCEEEVKDIIIS